MESIALTLPFDFIRSLTRLSWTELLFGLSHQLVKPFAAVEMATVELSESESASPNLMTLAGLGPTDRVLDLVRDLAHEDPPTPTSDVAAKWLFLTLAWLYEQREHVADPLGVVELIYADFDYPSEIEPFVRYMPGEGPDPGPEANEQQLLGAWAGYLETAKATFAPTQTRDSESDSQDDE